MDGVVGIFFGRVNSINSKIGLQPDPTLLLNGLKSTNTNSESVAYRSFRPSEFEARDVRKVTTGITDLWQPNVHSDVAFLSFDIDFLPTDRERELSLDRYETG